MYTLVHIFKGNNQKRLYPVRLESKTGTGWNQVKNTLDEPRDWPKTNRTRFSEIMTRVHLGLSTVSDYLLLRLFVLYLVVYGFGRYFLLVFGLYLLFKFSLRVSFHSNQPLCAPA